MSIERLRKIKGVTVESTHHADAILSTAIPEAIGDLVAVLKPFQIEKREVIEGGGGQTSMTMRLRDALYARQLVKQNIVQEHTVAGTALPSESHEIDHVKKYPGGWVALEIEWNNKDPFLDRDLENFRKLHQVGFLSVGIIVTRGATLQAKLPHIFIEHYSTFPDLPAIRATGCTKKHIAAIKRRLASAKRRKKSLTLGQAAGAVLAASKFGAATTHWAKLGVRVHQRAQGKPCPLLLIGIEIEKVIDFDPTKKIETGALSVDPELVAEQEGLSSD